MTDQPRYMVNREYGEFPGMTCMEVGSVQLVIAIGLYGMDSVLRIGDASFNGVVRVPNEDLECFLELVDERLAMVRKGRPQ